ncbi:LINE-1 retrotransposable element ORF2 protein [Vitis vinifera]|uniref:LINE-1 retrotransposable element ORF2 protein n=1 Tax=Vitis vinifera TaxID=29760 RepID=A0A438EZD8_VITVI|nr:LINE-1 retrotransposable element ORF2 protein [Vitis vinifera]
MEPKVGMLNGGRERKRGLGKDSGSSISLWNRDILSKVGEVCGGFLGIDVKTERMEELQWARIRVRKIEEKTPNMVEIWVENMCYSLTLWWETRPTLRVLPTGGKGKSVATEGEVEGEPQPREGKRVRRQRGLEPEVQTQSADGTRRLTSGSGRPMECSLLLLCGLFWAKEKEDLRRIEAWKPTVEVGRVADGQKVPSDQLAEAQRCGPSHAGSPLSDMSLFWEKDGMRWLGEAELLHIERSKTDLALAEEASRYVMVPFQSDCLVPVPPSSPLSFFGRTPVGEYCDLSGLEEKRDEDENPLQMLMGMESPVSETGECWDLVEASKSRIEDNGKGLGSDQIMPLGNKAGGELSWEKSDLAKFSKFLGFSTEGLEKDIMEFLETKIQTLSEGLVRSLGSGRWSNWVALDALGSAGGSWCVGQKVSGGDGDRGVYGPFSKEDRDCLWEELGAIRGLWEDPWCLGGTSMSYYPSEKGADREGGIATWNGGRNNQSWARLDRFLVTQQWLDMFSGERPTPFRFENMWPKVDGFIDLLWGGGKGLREVFGRLEVKKNSALQHLEYWDGVESERSLTLAEAEQKNKPRMPSIIGNNSMDRIMINGELLTEDQEVRDGIVNEFQKLLSEEQGWRADIEGLQFNQLSSRDADDLEVPFSVEEIHFALMEMRGDKAPGPDGFSVAFWQECWDFVKEEVKGGAKDLRDFRPISLLGGLYKLLAKVLANRLKKVLDRVVSADQNAFVRGRQILDASLVANEVIDYWYKRKEKGLICKLDIEKAYDNINWKFLMKVLFEFKGLRQGDPLSPYLFVLGMEVLSTLIRWAVDELEELAAELGCRLGALPTVYLGLPLGAHHKTSSSWDGVEERMRRRLAQWKRQYILKGGRITLIKSTLASIPIYLLSLIRIPKAVVCSPKEEGGLGIRKIDLLNKALLGKWVWRYAYEKDNLWKTVIGVKYGQERCGWKTKEVGKGNRVLFWTDKWCGNEALAQSYLQLFTLAGHNNAKVCEVWDSSMGQGGWNLSLARDFNDWEMDQIGDMLNF